MSHTIPADLVAALPHGVAIEHCTITTLAELAAEHEVEAPYDSDDEVQGSATVVVLPGYYATDGHAEIEYRVAESAKEAAREYVESGDWGERNKTIWIDVAAYRKALVVGEDDDVVEIRIDETRYTIMLDPEEPDCEDGREHDWRDRDVRGHGGGVIITAVCVHCGRYMIIDTWAQRHDTGEQGLRSIEYREADEISREWAEERRLDAADDRLTAAGYDTWLDRERRVVVVSLGEIDDDGAEDAVDTVEDRLGDDYIVTWSRDDDGDVRLYVSVA